MIILDYFELFLASLELAKNFGKVQHGNLLNEHPLPNSKPFRLKYKPRKCYF